MSKFIIEPVPVAYQHAVGGEWAVNDYAKEGQCAFAGSHAECEAWVARFPADFDSAAFVAETVEMADEYQAEYDAELAAREGLTEAEDRLYLATKMAATPDFRAIIPDLTDEDYLRMAKDYWRVEERS